MRTILMRTVSLAGAIVLISFFACEEAGSEEDRKQQRPYLQAEVEAITKIANNNFFDLITDCGGSGMIIVQNIPLSAIRILFLNQEEQNFAYYEVMSSQQTANSHPDSIYESNDGQGLELHIEDFRKGFLSKRQIQIAILPLVNELEEGNSKESKPEYLFDQGRVHIWRCANSHLTYREEYPESPSAILSVVALDSLGD